MAHPRFTVCAAVGVLAASLMLTGCGNDYDLRDSAGGGESLAAGGEATSTGGADAGDPDAGDPDAGDPGNAGADDPGSDTAAGDDASAPDDPPVDASTPAGQVTPTLKAATAARMGSVVTDDEGWILYRFDKDSASPSTSACSGDCAKVWPPVLAGQTIELAGGLSSKDVDTIERADGGLQVTIGGWPVYRYIGDKTPGSWKGQNVGKTWFVVQKNGKKNLTCVPEPPPAAAKVPTGDR